MTTDAIHRAFVDLISRRGVHARLGITSADVRNYRYKVKKGLPIRTETKLRLLQRTGYTQSDKEFSRRDLVSLLRFYRTTSQAARDMGEEYVIEKWELTKNNQP